MSDLTSGRYPAQSVLWSQFGQQNNVKQGDVPMFTNISPGTTLEDGTAQKTKFFTAAPVFIPYGVEIEKVSAFIGATAQSATTHLWAGVYSGLSPATIGGEVKPKQLATSKDETTLEPAATTTMTLTLTQSLLITPENAPHGFVYVGFFNEGTVASLASFKVATALTKATSSLKTFPWFAGAPLPAIQDKTSATIASAELLEEQTVVGVVPVIAVQ